MFYDILLFSPIEIALSLWQLSVTIAFIIFIFFNICTIQQYFTLLELWHEEKRRFYEATIFRRVVNFILWPSDKSNGRSKQDNFSIFCFISFVSLCACVCSFSGFEANIFLFCNFMLSNPIIQRIIHWKAEMWNFSGSIQLDIYQVSAVGDFTHLASHVKTLNSKNC